MGSTPLNPPEVDLAYSLEIEPRNLASATGSIQSWVKTTQAEEAWTSLLREWLGILAPELPSPLRAEAYSLGLRLVDDASITALNASWRGTESPTDVLAFAAQEESPPVPVGWGKNPPSQPLELGDIVISLETATRQALEAGTSLEQELLFLASHGLLHLLGWDHPDEDSLSAMLAQQEALLASASQSQHVTTAPCEGGSPS